MTLKERINSSYLIDRLGKVHKHSGFEYEGSIHKSIAESLFPKVKHAEDHVNKMGYVTVRSNKWMKEICGRELSQAQINTLDRLGIVWI